MSTVVSIANHPTFVAAPGLAVLDGVGQVHVVERSGQLRRIVWVEHVPVADDDDVCVFAEEIIERDEWISAFALRALDPESELSRGLLQSDFERPSFACETDFKSPRPRLVLVSPADPPCSIEAFSNHCP